MKLFVTLLLAASLSACGSSSDRDSVLPAVVRVAVLPDQSLSDLTMRYGPLVDYLETATGLEIELSIPSDYENLVDEFAAGRVHVANFGGLTFIQAERRSGAEPLVMRDVDLEFMSCYLAQASDTRRSIPEFQGEAFAFGPTLSTSGHLMPRHFLNADGMNPDVLFASTRHSSGHDQTAIWVSDGTVALGVANCDILQSMLDDGRLSVDSLRIVETTPPYADYVWATQAWLDPSVKIRLADAFLALDATHPSHRSLLAAQGANGYLPAGRDDFESVRSAAREAGLIDRDGPT